MRIGVDVLPPIPKDTTDRNRTSPIAFTGNMFEFRMLGSSQSIAGPNIALNTIMADALSRFADELEKAEDFDAALHKLVCEAFTAHQRIIFNGDGYSDNWKEEAACRGLSNLRSTPEALPSYISQKNIDLVTKHGIFTETEFRARYEIHLETYRKVINIEARTMVDMTLHQILPAALAYSSDLAKAVERKRNAGIRANTEADLAQRLSDCCDSLYEKCEQLHKALKAVPSGSQEAADYHNRVTCPQMQALRKDADRLEKLTAKSYWPYPTYSDILFY
jgi:glutamine synthetase